MAMASILGALGLMQSVPVLGGPELSAGSLLVASRDLDDPNFSRTVILLTSYGPDGAMGLVINRPAAILPEQVLPEIAGRWRRAIRFSSSGTLSSRTPTGSPCPIFPALSPDFAWSS